MGQVYLRWATALLAFARALYSLPNFLALTLGVFGVPFFVTPAPEVQESFRDLPVFLVFVWGGYLACFLLTGVLCLRNSSRAVLAAMAAVGLSAVYWVATSFLPVFSTLQATYFSTRVLILISMDFSILAGAVLSQPNQRVGRQ